MEMAFLQISQITCKPVHSDSKKSNSELSCEKFQSVIFIYHESNDGQNGISYCSVNKSVIRLLIRTELICRGCS